MHKNLVLTLIGCGLATAAVAQNPLTEYSRVSLSMPSSSTHVSRDQIVSIVVEGPTLVYESTPIAPDEVVAFVNGLLKEKKVAYIGVYVRAGSKYGDVVRAVDQLRKTDAKNVSVSMVELAPGRQP